MSDEIAVLNQGRVEQVGLPSELYDRPASPFVRDFLGQTIACQATSGFGRRTCTSGAAMAPRRRSRMRLRVRSTRCCSSATATKRTSR